MDGPNSFNLNPWAVASAAWAALVTLATATLTIVGGRHLHRIDKHSQRLDVLERTCVTKEEFNAAMNLMRIERREMHNENQNVLKLITEKIDASERTAVGWRGALTADIANLSTRVAVFADRMERKA